METAIIVKLGALGDVVRTTTLLEPLRTSRPNISITWVTQKAAIPLLSNNSMVDEVLDFEELSAGFRDRRFDLILSLDDEFAPCTLSSELYRPGVHLVGAYVDGTGKRIYTDSASNWFGMGRLRPEGQGGIAEANRLKRQNARTFQQHLFEMIGLNAEPRDYPPKLVGNPRNVAAAKHLIGSSETCRDSPLIGISSSSGERWKTKRIGVKRTSELACALIERFHANVVLLGGRGERARNSAVASECHECGVRLIDATTHADILDLVEVVRLLDLLITADSLAMHVATAVGTPVIAFFGPTPSQEIEFYGRGTAILSDQLCDCFFQPVCLNSIGCVDRIPIAKFLDSAGSFLR